LDTPLLGFDSPPRYVPKLPALDAGHKGCHRKPLSWGSLPLQRLQETRVHVSTGLAGCPAPPDELPDPFPARASTDSLSDRESASGSHPASYGAAPRFSQPLSGLLPLTSVPPFSDGWRSWGCALQGLHLSRSPDSSSPPAYPLDVLPSGCATSFLGRGSIGHARRT